jgi:hypothetical protein
MKRRLNGVLIVFVALTCTAIGWTVNAQRARTTQPPLAGTAPASPTAPVASAKTQWEYKIVAESDKIPLNNLGAEGWELVAVTNGGAEEVYYFKRAK